MISCFLLKNFKIVFILHNLSLHNKFRFVYLRMLKTVKHTGFLDYISSIAKTLPQIPINWIKIFLIELISLHDQID